MNPLVNVLTPKIRAILYAGLFVAALVFAAWQASDGDWLQFAGGVITSLLSATAASNASWTPERKATGQTPSDQGVDTLTPADTSTFHGGTGESTDGGPVVDVQGRHEAPLPDDYGYRA